MPRLNIPDEVAELIRGLHPGLKKKVREALKEILADPGSGKALKDNLAGLRSYHVSRFRIIYKVQGARRIDIVAVGPRERIYAETYRLIKRERSGGR